MRRLWARALWVARLLRALAELLLVAAWCGGSVAAPWAARSARSGGAHAVAAWHWLRSAVAAAASAWPVASTDDAGLTRAREWLQVPYDDRNAAKPLGARWDPQARKWHVPCGTPLEARDALVARWGLTHAQRTAAAARVAAATASPPPTPATEQHTQQQQSDVFLVPRRHSTPAAPAAPKPLRAVGMSVYNVPYARRREAAALGGVWREDRRGFAALSAQTADALARAGFELQAP